MTPLFRKFLSLNWVILLTMAGLIAFGIFAIHSASWMRPRMELVTAPNRQLKWALIGLVIFLGVSLIDYKWVRWLCAPTYLAGVVCLIMLRFVGVLKSNARSWLEIGPIGFQPSQLALIGTVMLAAVVLGELQWLHPIFRHHLLRLVIAIVVVGVPFLLILAEPDFGSASVFVPVAVFMVLVANIPFRYLTVLTLLTLIAVPLVYWFVLSPNQKGRIENYRRAMKGEQMDRRGSARDTLHLVAAIGSAGWEGKGYKGSRLKRENPEAMTYNEMALVNSAVLINDYVFSVIAEEHGFRGSMILITVLSLLLMQCLFVAFCSRDPLGRLLVVGTIALLFYHMFINIGMTIQVVPITGIPLPFISYGGTFLLICMFLMGLVQSVWIHRNEPVPEEKSLFV